MTEDTLARLLVEYLILARSLKVDSSQDDYERANFLSWLLAIWLPADLYQELMLAITSPSADHNALTAVVLARKYLGGQLGVTSEDIGHHAPGIGKERS